MKRIAHLVNPVTVPDSSDLYVAQPITLQSMRRAQKFARNRLEVHLLCAQFHEDRPMVPKGFTATTDLSRSALDFSTFAETRKLPLIHDIFQALLQGGSDCDYLIYSNIDISLMPFFYESILAYINDGFDGIMINRRTIPSRFRKPSQLPLMYAQTGKPHPGIDCFVVKRELIQKFEFKRGIIGNGPVGMIIAANLIAYCEKPIWLEDAHLTFHLGNDRSWATDRFGDYQLFAFHEYEQILHSLSSTSAVKNHKIKSSIFRQLSVCCKALTKLIAADHHSDIPEDIGEEYLIKMKGHGKKLIRFYCREKHDRILELEQELFQG